MPEHHVLIYSLVIENVTYIEEPNLVKRKNKRFFYVQLLLFLGASYYIGDLRVYQTEGRLLFLAVRHHDIYRADVQEKLKQLEVTALLKEETI